MDFSLSKYIKTKYLNESLLSDIFRNLLYDKSGFFFINRIEENWKQMKLVKRALAILSEIAWPLFYHKYQLINFPDNITEPINIKLLNYTYSSYYDYKTYDYKSYEDDRKQIEQEKIPEIKGTIDTVAKLKKLHKYYMDTYNEMVKNFTTLLDKPDPTILNKIAKMLNFKYDFYNLTDDQFKIYKLSDYKKDKILKDKIKSDLNNHVAIFRSVANGIEAISKNGYVRKYISKSDKDILERYKKFYISMTVINDNITKQTIETNTGEVLTFPVLNYNLIDQTNNICSICTENPYNQFTIGAINSKASNILKQTFWGLDPNDEIIIIYPIEHINNTQDYSNDYYSDTISGYNESKIKDNKRKTQRKKDFIESRKQKYLWLKTVLGDIIPYAGGKNKELYAFGLTLSERSYSNLFGNDKYCEKLANNNRKRYTVIIERNKAFKNITDKMQTSINYILNKLNNFVTLNEKYVNLVKELKDDYDKFNNSLILYGTYTKLLNEILTRFAWTLTRINDLNTYILQDLTDINSQSIAEKTNSVEISINSLFSNIDKLDEISEKISEIVSE